MTPAATMIRDQHAEDSVLGAMLIEKLHPDTDTTIDDVALIVTAADFTGDNGTVFQTIIDLHRAGKPVSLVSVAEHLTRTRPDETDWYQRLLAISNYVPHEAHAKYNASIVADKATRRRLHYLALDIDQRSGDQSIETEDVLAFVSGKLNEIAERRTGSQPVSMATGLSELLADLEREDPPGIRTGFREFDSNTSGLKPGQLIIVAARPAVGKTSLMQAICLHVSRTSGPVAIFSAEMERAELLLRMLSSQCGVEIPSLRGMIRNERQRQKLLSAAEDLSRLPLMIDDQPNRRIADIEAISRVHQRKSGLKLVAIDYLGLLQPDNPKATTEAQVAQLSRGCKMLAKSLAVPVLCLAQLNRAVESREDRRPRLSDLRSSGAIEQDADVVVFLDRPAMWSKSAKPHEASLIVAKNRNGRTADINLKWDGPTTTFSDPATEWHNPETYNPTGGE